MLSQHLARCLTVMIAFTMVLQIIPSGQAEAILTEQPQAHYTARIIPFDSGIATSLLGINQSKATVQFSHSSFANETFSSFLRIDTNDSILAQSRDPTIAIAPNDDIAIVWSQTFEGLSRIFISTSSNEGVSFSPPRLVTGTIFGNQTGPEIAVANGVLYVVWTESVPGESSNIYLGRSLDNGETFSAPMRVDHTGSSSSIQGFPEIAARGNDVCVVWHDSRDDPYFNIYGAISHDGGQTFGPAGDIRISDDTNNTEQSRPDVVYLNDGRILVIWQDRRSGDYDVRGAISTNGNSFSSSFLISDGPVNKDQSDPRLAVDPRGFVAVTWRDNRYVVGYHIFMRTSFDGIHYGVSKRVDDAPTAINCFSPDVTSSPNGTIFVAWSDDRSGISEVYFKAFPNLEPLVAITSPVEGAARSGPFSIVGVASDPEGSPDLRVEVQLQNSIGGNLTEWFEILVAKDGTWRTSLNSSHYANGNYRIVARSFDGLVYSSLAVVNVTFDNTRLPYIELTLTPDRILFYPNDPMALQNVSIVAEINNIGTKNATDVLVRFSWLNDSTLEPIGERLLANVTSGDQVSASVNWTSFQGDVTIVVQVDPLDLIVEDNKSNNTASRIIHVEPSRPDLILTQSAITISPDPAYSGDTVDISAIITNQGEKIASNFNVTIRINGTLILTRAVDELLPHHSTTIAGQWTAMGGSHVLQVSADPQHLLDDANFANNVAEMQFEVISHPRPMPDLAITNGTQLVNPGEPMVGNNVSFTATITNVGDANATSVNVTFYLDNEVLAYRSIAKINPGESVSSTVTWLAVLGTHELRIEIDPNRTVQERNRTNNVASKQFIVSPPVFLMADLSVDASDITMSPSNPTMGNVVYINVTVRNVGNGSAENVLIVGRMDGQQVGQNKSVPYFQAHSNATVSFAWFANEGEHKFQISIDPNSNITEASKANNNASRTFVLSGLTDMTSLAIAVIFIMAAIGVMAFYVIRVRKK